MENIQLDLNKEVVRNLLVAMGEFDGDYMEKNLADDIITWVPDSIAQGTGNKATIVAGMNATKGTFENFKYEIITMTAEEDRVAVEVNGKGKHISGRDYNNFYHFLFRVKENKIIEWKEHMDSVHFRQVVFGE